MSGSNKKQKPDRLIARAKTKFDTYPVKEPCELLEFLMKIRGGLSRNTAKSFLTHRQVYVDNIVTSQYNFPLQRGMNVQISKEKGKKEFRSNFLKLLYEDAYLLVVSKKEGLPVVSLSPREGNAQKILNEYIRSSGKRQRVYNINRLDKAASGLLLFAKDEKTRDSFNDRWNELVKEMRFVAVLSGEIEKDNGAIASWLTDNQIYITHSVISSNNSEKAVTFYNTIKRANGYSLVELTLGQGKKNQIRLHMHDLKNPILGDEKFNKEVNPLNRFALHAFKLNFRHPVTGESIEIQTPYPADFKKIMLRTDK